MLVQQEERQTGHKPFLGVRDSEIITTFIQKEATCHPRLPHLVFFLSLQSFTYVDQAGLGLTKICLLLLPERTDQSWYLFYFYFFLNIKLVPVLRGFASTFLFVGIARVRTHSFPPSWTLSKHSTTELYPFSCFLWDRVLLIVNVGIKHAS